MTVNVSRRGALLKGVHGKIRVGSQVSLSRSGKLEQFLIVWAGETNTPRAGQIGVSAVDPACSFWNDVIGAPSQAELASSGNNYSEIFQESQKQQRAKPGEERREHNLTQEVGR
jgi:hypothetical protein